MGRQLFITPSQLWTLLLNRYRMAPNQFDPGTVSDVAHTGSGTGNIRVTDLPFDAYFVELRCTDSGDTVPKISPVTHTGPGTGILEALGSPKGSYQVRVEIMSVGYFRYSLNGGASYSVSYPIPSPTLGKLELPGTGLTLCFIPGNSGFAVGDYYTFTTVGPARFSATSYVVSNPIESGGTGTVSPSGPVAGPYTISVCICECGGTGTAKFVYSVNGGKLSEPITVTPTFTIPCVGITLNFDAGCTGYDCGSVWVFSTKGSASFTVGSQPIEFTRPEQTGLRLVFEPTTSTSPAYVAGDLYTFSTTAPPDLLEECRAASDEAYAKLRARYMKQTIIAWDRSVIINTGRIAMLTVYDRKGMNFREDRQSIEKAALRAHEFFTRVGSKLEHPLIVATPLPGILSPRAALGPDDTGIGAGPFGDSSNDPFGPGIIVPYRL